MAETTRAGTVTKLGPHIRVTDPVAEVLCYPHPTEEELRRRIEELLNLGITHIVSEGPVQVGRFWVLGKGCVGIVVKALLREQELVAVKIRRVDANRESLEHEARYLSVANSVGVGPQLITYSRNFLVREYVEGIPVQKWLEERPGREELRKVLRELLEQCWRLDQRGLYHAQLTNPSEHVFVKRDLTPVILDFETASLESRRSNVTAVAQYFFTRPTWVSEYVRSTLGIEYSRSELIQFFRKYKLVRTREVFEELLRCLRLL